MTCVDTPGQRTGTFAPPDPTTSPVLTFDLTDPTVNSVASLDLRWDVSGPSSVDASQASSSDDDPDGVSADTDSSGLPALAARDLSDFAGRDVGVILTASADSPELPQRARAVLRESGWFIRCEGSTDLSSLSVVPRVGDVVSLAGLGSLLSGNYLVWSLRHTITADRHGVAFTLVSNAVGAPPSGAAALSPTGVSS